MKNVLLLVLKQSIRKIFEILEAVFMNAKSIWFLMLCLFLFGNFTKANSTLGNSDSQLAENSEMYIFESDVELELFDSPEQIKGRKVNIPIGTEVTVVEQWPQKNFGQYAKIYIDSDILAMPAEAWVRVVDLQNNAQLLEWDINDYVWNIDDSNEDIMTGFVLMGAPPKRRTPSCYRDVKYELLRRKLVHRYPPGAAAWMGYDVLRLQFNFKPVAFSQELPDGAVCVSEGGKYRCGKKACGHIAVKTGKGKWYGAGVFPHPLLRGHYNLRCLVKN